MNRDAEARVSLAADLRHAIERNELVPYYQPKIDLETHQVIGAEALIRWVHPVRGIVSPELFIPIAEETNLIETIGDWVIREAVQQLSAWQRHGVLDELSINVSHRQIRDNDLAITIERTLKENRLEPSTLEIEITETTMAENLERAVTTLNAISDMGGTRGHR